MKKNAIEAINFKHHLEGKHNFEEVLVSTEGKRNKVWEMIILKLLFQPRNSQETKQVCHASTPCCTVGTSLLLPLADPRERSNLIRGKLIFFSFKRCPLGSSHNRTCERRTEELMLPQGKVTSSRKEKRVLLLEDAFCLAWVLKMGQRIQPLSLNFRVQSIFYLLTWNNFLLFGSFKVQLKTCFL